MNENLVELHAVVQGRVQGVGFRATTRVYALQLGLVGTVRNCLDGKVEIHAQGTKNALNVLLESLRAQFQIENIATAYQTPSLKETSFRITD